MSKILLDLLNFFGSPKEIMIFGKDVREYPNYVTLTLNPSLRAGEGL